MIAIKNATLVMRDHLIPEAVLFIEDGIIAGFGEMRNTPIPESCEIVDAEGLFVGPGLIDIHNHAGNGHWFYDEPIEAAQFNLQHGTTTMLPTLYFNQNKENVYDVCPERHEKIHIFSLSLENIHSISTPIVVVVPVIPVSIYCVPELSRYSTSQ